MVYEYEDSSEIPDLETFKKRLIVDLFKSVFFQQSSQQKYNMLKLPIIAAPSLIRKQVNNEIKKKTLLGSYAWSCCLSSLYPLTVSWILCSDIELFQHFHIVLFQVCHLILSCSQPFTSILKVLSLSGSLSFAPPLPVPC